MSKQNRPASASAEHANLPECKPKNMIAAKLTQLRIERNLTQKDISDVISQLGGAITSCTLSKIENQRRSVTDIELFLLARVFDISVDEFFT